MKERDEFRFEGGERLVPIDEEHSVGLVPQLLHIAYERNMHVFNKVVIFLHELLHAFGEMLERIALEECVNKLGSLFVVLFNLLNNY